MVGAFGEVQVMDWGLAKVLATGPAAPGRPDPDATLGTEIRSARGEGEATQAGSMLGTPAFMPPEQAIGAVDQIDERSDGFALGGGLLLALAAGAAGTRVGLVRAERARADALAGRDAAAKARDRTRQVLDDMTSEVTGDSLATQREISREQQAFLAAVVGHYRELAGERGGDPEGRARAASAAYRAGLIEGPLG